MDRGRARIDGSPRTAGPTQRPAIRRSAPDRGRRRCRRHLYLLPAGGRSAGQGGRADQGPSPRRGPARRGARADSPVVRCVFEIENRSGWHRLRARIPTGVAGTSAVAGAAFGAVVRAPVDADPGEYPLETPVRTAPAQRFVAVASGSRGLAVLAPGFFEYEWTRRGDLVLTLLRAVGELSRADLPTRPGHAAWPTHTPLAQSPGVSRIELALAPVSRTEVDRGDVLPALWEDTFLPLRGFWLRDAVELSVAPIDIALEGSGLVLSAIKPAQQGSPLVLRCYNATDRKTAGAWRFGEGVKSAHRVRADERESVALVLEGRGKTVRFAAEPHEIVTILVT
ncbi:MAG: hypothetical protein DMD67_14270 [Gemmatimonadetes bacterium]|nr:MAG: hypothetical protein DMD67_14270 [Gemmatimonadota bacterium]